MKTTHILLLCILGAALLSAVKCSNGPDNCCFKFYPRKYPSLKLIKSYRLTDRRCPMPAVIFFTKLSSSICMDPSASSTKILMKILDRRSF
uniref:C-C motif chemokine 13-like n=1 Tax=Neolamprologus brichardi TaxID=32507 RepID=A0A3Q4H3U5_NEOBR